MPDAHSHLPILIVGAGPVGLAAAARCVERGLDFLLLEAGPQAGWAVRQWRHVRLFSPWNECLDRSSVAVLGPDWAAPDGAAFPTGAELVTDYIDPLAGHPSIRPHLRLGCQVTHYTRRGAAKQWGEERFARPFVAVTSQGDLLGRAILDATGTWGQPRRLPQTRAAVASSRILYGIPDLASARVRKAFARRRVLVIGSGHSGMTTILDLIARLKPADLGQVIWLRRSPAPRAGRAHPPGSARRALEARAEAAARDARIRTVDRVSVAHLVEGADGVTASGHDRSGAAVTLAADVAVVSTGYRPDLALGSELWMAVDHRWEAPAQLAGLIDPDRHACGGVPAQGVEILAHPERDFFILGAKSYGRAPNFALSAGYEQAAAIVAHLDRAKAA